MAFPTPLAPFGAPNIGPTPQGGGGFIEGLGNFASSLGQNPLFMAGLTGLGGQGPGAGAQIAQQAQQQRMQQAEFERQQQQRQRTQQIWGSVFPNGQPNLNHPLAQGAPPELLSLAGAMGPEEGLGLLGKWQFTRSDDALKQAQAKWYQERPRASTGATGELADRLMRENPGMSLEEAITIARRGDIAGAAAATEQGKAMGTAAAGLPLAEAAADRMTRTIDDALRDPALSRVTGPLQGWLPNVTSGANRAQSKVNQILGGTFLQAYNDLRGGGQITEIEGKKATDAYNRLTSQTMNDADYRTALQEFRAEVQRLRDIARQRAGGRQSALPASTTPGQMRRNIGGKNYVKVDGQWFEE